MENNHLAVLQAEKTELLKAIKAVQKKMDRFDVSQYYDEDMFIEEMREEFGMVKIMGQAYYAIDTLQEIDNIAFREMFNNHLDALDKGDFEEYKELEEELEELENELAGIEEALEELENE